MVRIRWRQIHQQLRVSGLSVVNIICPLDNRRERVSIPDNFIFNAVGLFAVATTFSAFVAFAAIVTLVDSFLSIQYPFWLLVNINRLAVQII